ncbi:YtxH domain-containing protein [Pedobacter sp.]|uniref:YtxH domain-containing protein n=1 Tax=Pedobacter sp. TaxID=1411316 RepID=UPI003D7F8C3B
MGLLKTVLIGAAVYGAFKYATKKDANGRSIVDDLKDKAPEYMDKAKKFKEDLETKYTGKEGSVTDPAP